jgi:K+-transporting ATPase ATPase C chain
MFNKTILPALRLLIVMTVITGVIYPLVITIAAQALFPDQANGSLLRNRGTVVGSALIGQSFDGDKRYFWSRPSAITYNPLPSSGSNLGPTSASLQEAVRQREADFRAANSLAADIAVPADVIFASGSGLDPHISPESARLQSDRVANARGLDVTRIRTLVDQYTETSQFGILGQPRVNVLLLNLALDQLK